MKCNLSHIAQQDVLDVTKYLKSKNRELAESFFDELENVREIFSKFPKIAPLINDELQNRSKNLKGIHFWVMSKFNNYTIFYREKDEGVVIIRIIHSKRDMPNMFNNLSI